LNFRRFRFYIYIYKLLTRIYNLIYLHIVGIGIHRG